MFAGGKVESMHRSGESAGGCEAVFRAVRAVPAPTSPNRLGALTPRPEPNRRPVKGSIGELVVDHLAELVRELLRRDPDARADQHDGVHRMRVATRRLRSALATYRPILTAERTEPVRDELRWLGGALGSPRDAEVLRDWFGTAIQSLPGDLGTGNVVELVVVELRARHQVTHANLLHVLDGARYVELLDALGALSSDPPLNDQAGQPAATAVDRLVRKTVRRVHEMAAAAEMAADGVARERALHELRKAAKRARYAAESAVPALGKRSTRLARRMKRLQDLLGEMQDSLGSRRLLREIAEVSHLIHEDVFAFGVLYGREEDRARAALEGYERALRDVLRTG
jgi:CHAD domain-containing protein